MTAIAASIAAVALSTVSAKWKSLVVGQKRE